MNEMTIKFDKQGLVPAIIQDSQTLHVLMLGYMNEESFKKTQETGLVTFYSRSKQRLWTKGEESGNTLKVVTIKNDCDKDTLLIHVKPAGPTCHLGTTTCWGEPREKGFVYQLEQIITTRLAEKNANSYTQSLVDKGLNKVVQKVGEEATEVIIEALNGTNELLKEESADLLYHFLLMLNQKGLQLADVEAVLQKRHKDKT